MLLKTAYWIDSTQAYSSLATESTFLSYTIIHEFNQPARCDIELSDPAGAMMQKYKVDAANDIIYIGPGRAYIEDPTGTPIFDGRILNVVSDMQRHITTLSCQDWLSQLDDTKIDYDMRKDLDGAGLRQSEFKTDIDGAKVPTKNDAGTFYIYDDDMAWSNDAFNDMNVMMSTESIGDITVVVGPCEETVTPAAAPIGRDLPANGEEVMWTLDNTGPTTSSDTLHVHEIYDGSDDFYVVYDFAVHVTESSLFTTCGSGKVEMLASFYCSDPTTSPTCIVYAYNHNSAAWVEIGALQQQFPRTSSYTYYSFDIPVSLLGTAPYLVDTDGLAHIKFDMTCDAAAQNSLRIDYLWVLLDCTVTGYSSAIAISDTTNPNRLTVGTDLSPSGLSLWEGFKYSIADYIYKHIDTAESGDLVVYFHEDEIDKAYRFDSSATSYTDETTDMNDAGAGDVQMMPDPVGQNDAFYFGCDILPSKFKFVVSQAGNYTGTWTWQYWNGSAWANLASVTDNTNRFKTAGTNTVSWAWTSQASGSPKTTINGEEKFWIKWTTGTALPTVTTLPLVTQGWAYYPMTSAYRNGAGAITAAANIEHTAGISTRNYKDRTRLEIVQDVAIQDKANFWVPLATVALTWKSTFNDGAPDAVTDASVLSWNYITRDFREVFNNIKVYGIRIGTTQLSANENDKTSFITYGTYRTEVISQTGLISQYDTTQLAEKLLERDKDIKLYLQAEIGGISALRLGDEISITSTYLGLTAQVYTITNWKYDSRNYRTTILLHPRVTETGHRKPYALEEVRQMTSMVRMKDSDQYNPSLTTQEW